MNQAALAEAVRKMIEAVSVSVATALLQSLTTQIIDKPSPLCSN